VAHRAKTSKLEQISPIENQSVGIVLAYHSARRINRHMACKTYITLQVCRTAIGIAHYGEVTEVTGMNQTQTKRAIGDADFDDPHALRPKVGDSHSSR
jgi:hypothetical protein